MGGRWAVGGVVEMCWRMAVEFGRRRGREGKARVEIRGVVRGPVWFVKYSDWAWVRAAPVRLLVEKRLGEVSGLLVWVGGMGWGTCSCKSPRPCRGLGGSDQLLLG